MGTRRKTGAFAQARAVTTFTNSLNRTTTDTYTGGQMTSVKRPGASANSTTFAYASGKVCQVVNEGVTADPATGKSYTYSSENLLATGPNGTSLGYDPGMRLREITSGGTTTRFGYDGLDRIAEYDAASSLLRRYVHGPGMDEPLVWYEGSGTTDRKFLSSDERGSIISVSDSAGALLGINRYDEYGQPQATNLGAFGYTGQAWLPTVGAWYYKARVYDSEIGRFLQTDPIGYAGGINLYAYVANDPVNWNDPFGLAPSSDKPKCDFGGTVINGECTIEVTGQNCSYPFYINCKVDRLTRIPDEYDRRNDRIGGHERERERTPRPQRDQPRQPQSDWCGSDEANAPDGNWGGACRKHDICYATSGSNKESCDAQLITDIFFECTGRSARGAAPACALIGFTYGVGLIIGGFEARLCGAGGCGPTLFGPSRRAFNRAQGRD